MPRIHWKGSALLAPVPSVLVTCGTEEKANVLTVGWCGVISTRPPRVYVSVRPERFSYGIIKESREFVINLTPSSLFRAADYCGTLTGRRVDKLREVGFSLIPSEKVAPPAIAECPLSLECRVFDVIPSGSHDVFLADVLSVSLDDSLLDASGRMHLERAGLLVFTHGEYFETGRRLGKIGVSTESKKPPKLTQNTEYCGRSPAKPQSDQKNNGIPHTKRRNTK